MGNCLFRLSFLFLLISCIEIKASVGIETICPLYEMYVNEIIRSFTDTMEREFNLKCIGDGGRMPNDVEEISVAFVYYKKATVDQARLLEVKAIETLLQIVNSHEKIRPYLREYPFKSNRVEISISFRKLDNSSYTDDSVARVTQIRNTIYYRGTDGSSKNYYSLGEESFEKALKIAQNPLLEGKKTNLHRDQKEKK